jgi:hypothetical protein
LKPSPVFVGRLVFVLVFLISALYMAKELRRGWVPHDEGTLGQSAERVLLGEVPHRDFDDIYTGGLSYLNAAAFRVFGTKLTSLRYVLYLFFLAWVPSVYYAASRFVSSPIAGAVTLLAVAWAVPNYAAAMPSWYNLFFASFGVASVLRYIDTRSGSWLSVAGLCGGISFLFKVSGLFFIAGILLFFLLPDESIADERPLSRAERDAYRTLLLVSVLSYNSLLLTFIRKGANLVSFYYFVVPEVAIGVFIVWHEFARGRGRGQRFVVLLRKLALFGGGVAVPVVAFLVRYVAGGTVSQFLYGVFVLPAKRFAFASHSQTPLWLFSALGADLAVVAAVFLSGPRVWKVIGSFVLVSVPILLISARREPLFYRGLWTAIWTLLPLVVVLGLIVLTDKRISGKMADCQRQRVFLVLSVTASCSLIQFPFSGSIYFCYVAPLLLLATTAVLSTIRQVPRFAVAGLAIFFLLYAVLDVTPGFIYKMGNTYAPDIQKAALDLPRAGSLRLDAADVREYNDLGTLVLQHARGPYLFCTPDCPEVYFLFGFRNPGRTLFDFFDEPAGRTARILALLRDHNVNLVVLSRAPAFSGQVPSDLRAVIEREFPNRAATKRFEVRWQP